MSTRTPRRRVTTAIAAHPSCTSLTNHRPPCFPEREPQPIRRDPSVLDARRRDDEPGRRSDRGQRNDARVAAALGRRDLGALGDQLTAQPGRDAPSPTQRFPCRTRTADTRRGTAARDDRQGAGRPWKSAGGRGAATAAPWLGATVHARPASTGERPRPAWPRGSETRSHRQGAAALSQQRQRDARAAGGARSR